VRPCNPEWPPGMTLATLLLIELIRGALQEAGRAGREGTVTPAERMWFLL